MRWDGSVADGSSCVEMKPDLVKIILGVTRNQNLFPSKGSLRSSTSFGFHFAIKSPSHKRLLFVDWLVAWFLEWDFEED